MTYRCAACQSERVIPGATIFDQGQHSDSVLRVGIATEPQAMLFKGMYFTTLRAMICGDCGHVQLAVENPGELYAAYQENLRASGR